MSYRCAGAAVKLKACGMMRLRAQEGQGVSELQGGAGMLALL